MGVIVNSRGNNAPYEAKLHSYQAAQWTAFAFGITGGKQASWSILHGSTFRIVLAMTLGAIFFRGVGIVGHEKTMRSGDQEIATGSEQTVTNSRTADIALSL